MSENRTNQLLTGRDRADYLMHYLKQLTELHNNGVKVEREINAVTSEINKMLF